MNASDRLIKKICRVFVLISLTAFGFSLEVPLASAQCAQQAPQGFKSFAPNTTVYYKFDTNANFGQPAGSSTKSPQTQIADAFAAWSAANTAPGGGGDGITFKLADAQNPATVTIETNPSTAGPPGKSDAAITMAAPGTISSSNPATITFYPNLVILHSGGAWAFDPSKLGYDSVFFQDALHEIGHLQGIGDFVYGSPAPPPGKDSTIMIGHIGTNGIGNKFLKPGPTPCDVLQATKTSAAVTATGGGGGGGGGDDSSGTPVYPDGGGGGGGGGGCTDICDATCSNYNPTDPSCGDKCTDICNPNCPGYYPENPDCGCLDACNPMCTNFDPVGGNCGCPWSDPPSCPVTPTCGVDHIWRCVVSCVISPANCPNGRCDSDGNLILASCCRSIGGTDPCCGK